jgi:hypothetical protein
MWILPSTPGKNAPGGDAVESELEGWKWEMEKIKK